MNLGTAYKRAWQLLNYQLAEVLLLLLTQDRVTICNDAEKKKNKKKTLDWLYFLLRFPPNVTMINYSFPMRVSLMLNNIIEVVKNK